MNEKQELFQISEEEFLESMADSLKEFMASPDTERHLPAMNSFHRRLTHQLATRFGLETRSEGDNKERHIVVAKTSDSAVPEDLPHVQQMNWNFGDREFFVDPLQAVVEVYLAKDGTIGSWSKNLPTGILAKKKITSGSFKIKQDKIVEIHDPEW